MNRMRILLITLVVLLLVAGLGLWWTRFVPVDMSTYAPADSVVYLEVNDVAKVFDAIQQTDGWKAIGPTIGMTTKPPSAWQTWLARTGIGPANAVILSRAQVAVVMVGLNQVQTEDTLHVRPELAVIVETHTSNWRLRSALAEQLRQLANYAYGQADCVENPVDQFVCSSSGSERKIFAIVDGSVLVIGNSEKAVQACVDARRGNRPNLRTDAQMLRVRSSLASGNALSFGYISSQNAARLFSWAAPLLIGKPGDSTLEKVLENSAEKIVRNVAWTSSSAGGGIEDRMLISLDPMVASKLTPAFEGKLSNDDYWKLVPPDADSVTRYACSNPGAAWQALNSAVAMRMDAVSSVLFGSLLKSSLGAYGIDDPRELLSAVKPPLLTLRPAAENSGSVLIARVEDKEHTKQLLNQAFRQTGGQVVNTATALNDQKEFSAVLLEDYVVLGRTEVVRTYLDRLTSTKAISDKFRHFAPDTAEEIVTFANDEQRIRNMVSFVSSIRKTPVSAEQLKRIEATPSLWSYSSTETSLSADALDRRTRSAFGQFSTLISLLQQDSSGSGR